MTIIGFSEWLRETLDERGLKPNALALKAGLDPGIISRAINRERLPSPESLSAIAHALDLPDTEVFRAAGVLSPNPVVTPLIERAIFYLSEFDIEDQERIVLYLEFLHTRFKYGGQRP